MQAMRTYNEIYQSIVDKKNTTTELSEINSVSQTAIWLALAKLTATAIFIFETIVYSRESVLEKQIARSKYGFTTWYSIEGLKFQYGDSLVFDSEKGTYYYDEIDESKLIIARASTTENENTAQIKHKVAKDSSGTLVKLLPAELIAYTAYMQFIKVAGTNISIISKDADIININGNVKYNSQYSEIDIKVAVATALDTYKLDFSYDGILRRNDIIQQIRAVNGVIDFVPTIISGQASGELAVPITEDYEAASGYFNYNGTPSDNFTYTAL